jgi:hypothetical protein
VDPIRSYVYVTEVTGHRIRRIDTVTGAVSNLVGNGLCSFADGVGSNAGLCGPTSLAINSTGSFLYVADTNNYRIRRVDLSSGYISTLAGNGTNGFTSGLGLQVLISTIQSIALDTNTARLFFAESSPSYRIRWLDLNTNIVSTLAGTRPGSFDAIGTAATFSNYQAIAVDPTGSYLMVSDGNSRIRMISLSNRVVQTLTATPAVYASNPSNYAVVSINGFHFDSSGQYVYYTQSNSVGMYVASSGVQVLLNVPNVSVSNYSFPSFQSLACDTTCLNLYVADANSNTISRISFRNVCPAAYYCPTGIATPTPCPPGSYCLAMSSVPTPCTAGSYCGITGLTAVTGPCSGGFFCQSGSSTATQFNCPPGSFCPVGSVNTTICPISTFCPNMSSTPLSCTVGGYCPTTALAAPVSCDPGSFCASTGLTTVSGACISGFYCASGAVNPYGGYGT